MGSDSKLVCAKPATVIHRSTPWRTVWSPAMAGEAPIRDSTTATATAERLFHAFIVRSFPGMGLLLLLKCRGEAEMGPRSSYAVMFSSHASAIERHGRNVGSVQLFGRSALPSLL